MFACAIKALVHDLVFSKHITAPKVFSKQCLSKFQKTKNKYFQKFAGPERSEF